MNNDNNRGMSWIVKSTLAIFMLLGASLSYADCEQSDLKGTWYFTGVTGDTLFGDFWETDFCKIKVNLTGKVVDSSSQCEARDFEGKYGFDISGGALAINSSCSITGKFKLCEDTACIFLKIDDARMDKGKTVITLAGRLSDEPDIVSFFTGIKK